MRMHPNPSAVGSGLVIPRARVSHHRGPGSHFSDDDFMSPVEVCFALFNDTIHNVTNFAPTYLAWVQLSTLSFSKRMK